MLWHGHHRALTELSCGARPRRCRERSAGSCGSGVDRAAVQGHLWVCVGVGDAAQACWQALRPWQSMIWLGG
jgi:hypothetical protein